MSNKYITSNLSKGDLQGKLKRTSDPTKRELLKEALSSLDSETITEKTPVVKVVKVVKKRRESAPMTGPKAKSVYRRREAAKKTTTKAKEQ